MERGMNRAAEKEGERERGRRAVDAAPLGGGTGAADE